MDPGAGERYPRPGNEPAQGDNSQVILKEK
jgi:hypothetical protein